MKKAKARSKSEAKRIKTQEQPDIRKVRQKRVLHVPSHDALAPAMMVAASLARDGVRPQDYTVTCTGMRFDDENAEVILIVSPMGKQINLDDVRGFAQQAIEDARKGDKT